MAKAFDLIHKVTQHEEPESRIPFEDDPLQEEKPTPPKRPRIEMAFFYILLFIIFFVMGSTLLSPRLFGNKQASTASPSPSNTSTPQQGFDIEKDGQSVTDAQGDLGVSTTPSPSIATSPSAVASNTPATQTSTAAKVQILNGTNRTGAAAALRTKLVNAGIAIASVGNYKTRTVARTTVFYKADFKAAATEIQGVTGGILSETSGGIGSYDVLVVIGAAN